MNKKKVILGLTGETGAGKDTVADYYEEKFGAKLLRFADPIKDTLSIYFDKLSKEDQAWLYEVFKDRFGGSILGRALKKRVEDETAKFIVINGLRMPSDYDFIRQFDDAKILYVTTSPETRWKRVLERGEKTDDKLPFEEFMRLDRKLTEVHVPEIGAKADFRIDNEKDLDYLYDESEKVLKKIGILNY